VLKLSEVLFEGYGAVGRTEDELAVYALLHGCDEELYGVIALYVRVEAAQDVSLSGFEGGIFAPEYPGGVEFTGGSLGSGVFADDPYGFGVHGGDVGYLYIKREAYELPLVVVQVGLEGYILGSYLAVHNQVVG
jgi:hypothetical protein